MLQQSAIVSEELATLPKMRAENAHGLCKNRANLLFGLRRCCQPRHRLTRRLTVRRTV
jgi:hypothetical protein